MEMGPLLLLLLSVDALMLLLLLPPSGCSWPLLDEGPAVAAAA